MLYLDNSSTTKIHKDVIKTMNDVMEKYWFNPSSLHEPGVQSEKVLKQSRKILSDFFGVVPEEIIFTSGGTESNNVFIRGVLEEYAPRGNHIITTKIEHPAVSEVIKTYQEKGWDVTWLDVNEEGIISLEDLEKALTSMTVLTAIMHVNNETGSIQPIKEAAKIVKNRSRSLFFSDGVQGFLKVPFDLSDSLIDGYSISGHKINGPKGTGALYINKKVRLKPLIQGGGQERGIRSGTENLPGIAGLAKAVQIHREGYIEKYRMNLRRKKEFLQLLSREVPEIRINSPLGDEMCSPYIINCSLPGIQGETILHALEEAGIYVSTGSACSGRDKSYSRVLREMALAEEYLKGAIRISLGLDYWPDEKDEKFTVENIKNVWNRLK